MSGMGHFQTYNAPLQNIRFAPNSGSRAWARWPKFFASLTTGSPSREIGHGLDQLEQMLPRRWVADAVIGAHKFKSLALEQNAAQGA